jgi:hypothetical protein
VWVRFWPVSVRRCRTLTGGYTSYFSLLCGIQRIIDLNAQIANRAPQLRMAKR